MNEVIAMHGWAGDSEGWQAWASHFQARGWNWQSCERGYGSIPTHQAQWTETPPIKDHKRNVFIGHSLGLHLINSKVLSEATDVVLVASFSRFVPKNSTNRSISIALNSMRNLLGTQNENQMLKTFLGKAFHPNSVDNSIAGPIQQGISSEGRKKLKADLDLLIETKALPAEFPSNARVLVIEGAKDEIILPQTRKDLIKDLTSKVEKPISHWIIEEGGHTLMTCEVIEKACDWLEQKNG